MAGAAVVTAWPFDADRLSTPVSIPCPEPAG